jgi:hypothetical protein
MWQALPVRALVLVCLVVAAWAASPAAAADCGKTPG